MPISALLTGAGSAKPALKSGPLAAMKFIVSAREKLPCMPWPCCSPVSAISAVQRSAAAQPVAKLRKFTAIAGIGVSAEPCRLIAESAKVPAKRPSAGSTKSPLT